MSFGDWLDERVGHRKLVSELLDEPVVGGARWAYVWGSALTLSLVVQTISGFLLMSAYAPSATTAWSSVAYITYEMRAGWVIRGLHHFGAQAMVVLLVLHIAQTALFGAYRRPREMNWLFGIALLLFTLGFALTGYLLPWDQKGYWATRVATNIAGTTPLLGGALQRLLVGGSEYGHLTLTRFYALHVGVLPALTVMLLVGHVALMRKHGITPAFGANPKKVDRFFPKQLAMDLAVSGVVLAIVFALAIRAHGAPLDAPADPASDYPARPEWYFLALFQLLKYFKGSLEPIGAIGIPTLVIGYLVLLPFLDRAKNNSLAGRVKVLAPLLAIGLGATALTLQSKNQDAADAAFQKAESVAATRAKRAITLALAGVPPEGPLAMMRSDPATRGPELFAANCAACHKLGDLAPKDGKARAPDLTGYGTEAWARDVLDDPDKDHLFGATALKGTMPSMVHAPADPEAAKVFVALQPNEIDAIAAFLAAEASGKSEKGSAGEKLVAQKCTACHRLDGKTLDDDSLAPELRGWASTAYIAAQITNPGSGKAYPKGIMAAAVEGHMPAFKEKLSASEIELLAKWIHSSPK